MAPRACDGHLGRSLRLVPEPKAGCTTWERVAEAGSGVEAEPGKEQPEASSDLRPAFLG